VHQAAGWRTVQGAILTAAMFDRIVLTLLAAAATVAAQSAGPKTMRLDYYHIGTATEEQRKITRIRLEKMLK